MEISKKCAGALIALLLLVGCGVSEKGARNYAYKNKDKLAEWCLDCFPVKRTGEVKEGEIIYMPSDTVLVESTDTVTVVADCPDGTKVEKKCPPCKDKIVKIPMLRVDTVEVVDTALDQVLSDTRSREVSEGKRADKWRNYFTILLGLGIAYVLIRR